MSVQLAESQATVAPSMASRVPRTPGLKQGLKTTAIPPSHPLDPLSPEEVTFFPGLCYIPF